MRARHSSRRRARLLWSALAAGVLGAGSTSSCAAKISQPPVVVGAGEAQAACAIVQGGRVHCWFKDDPYWIPNVTDARAVAVHQQWGCALRGLDVVTCWQHSTDLGVERTDLRTAKLSAPSRISVSSNKACAIVANGQVMCWTLDPLPTNPLAPLVVPSYSGVVELALYYGDALYLHGDGGIEGPNFPLETAIPEVVQVALGDHFGCFLSRQGEVLCGGSNWMGRLGDGTWKDHDRPRAIQGPSDVAEIAAGIGHACARHADGAVTCWGSNQYGQVGVASKGMLDNRALPVRVPGVNAVSLSAVRNGTCVVTTAHELVCWGAGHGPRRMEISAPRPSPR